MRENLRGLRENSKHKIRPLVKPVRAINSKGEWRIVLNYLKAKNDFIAQTVRIELCDHPGEKCPKIPGKKIYFRKFVSDSICNLSTNHIIVSIILTAELSCDWLKDQEYTVDIFTI